MGGEGEGVGNDVYVPTGHMAGSHIGAVEWSSVWSIYRKLAGADRLCPRVLEREDDNKVSLDTQPAATVDTPASPDFRDIFLVEPPIHLEGRSVECDQMIMIYLNLLPGGVVSSAVFLLIFILFDVGLGLISLIVVTVGNDGYVPTGHMAGSHIGAVEWSSVWSLYRKLAGADRLCPRVLGGIVRNLQLRVVKGQTPYIEIRGGFMRNCQKPPGTSRQCPSLSGISSLLRGRDFMATVGAVCNIHTNKMCLTLIDKNIFYDPSVKMTMRCLEFILHRLIAITCIIHHRSCQMLGKNNPGRDYSSFRAGRRPSNFCLEKLQLKSLLPSLPPGNGDRSWTSGTGAGGCEWEARPAGRSSVLSSRKVVVGPGPGRGRAFWLTQGSNGPRGPCDQSAGLGNGSKPKLGLLWGGYRRWDVNGTCCTHSPNKLYPFGLGAMSGPSKAVLGLFAILGSEVDRGKNKEL
ncbi:hypothetical protein F2Q68_00034037 [Brassica cretica]|uniref:Uncharacterized protein n=1 Tax=Brassica cretica TaxID=69181 RepID=A0A8S9GZG3_BRACR|nr:hypothetical protein F2Q68_00034037 [Brassica cretica]